MTAYPMHSNYRHFYLAIRYVFKAIAQRGNFAFDFRRIFACLSHSGDVPCQMCDFLVSLFWFFLWLRYFLLHAKRSNAERMFQLQLF